MKTFRHDINERNKSNVIKLRMKYGAAGYGIYMMLLERLAMEPTLRAELDYDILAYDFQESAELIQHVVEDFNLFTIDIETETFSNEELIAQLPPKTRAALQEKLLDEYIRRNASSLQWVNNVAGSYSIAPERVRALVNTVFREKVLSAYSVLPSSARLGVILNTLLRDAFGNESDS